MDGCNESKDGDGCNKHKIQYVFLKLTNKLI